MFVILYSFIIGVGTYKLSILPTDFVNKLTTFGDFMAVHQKLRLARESRSLSQEKMAEQLHMSLHGYAKIERGETKLHLDKLEQIANVLEMDIFELMTFGEKGVLLFQNENGNFNNINYYNTNSNLTNEIEKLNLSIQHCQELLAQKDILIEQQKSEISGLKEMVTLLKNKKDN